MNSLHTNCLVMYPSQRLQLLIAAQVESEDLVFTLETIVEKFGEEMAPYAVGVCQHLTQAFWRACVRPVLSWPDLQLCMLIHV